MGGCPRNRGERQRKRQHFSLQQEQWAFRRWGRGLGLLAALPHCLCRCSPETGDDGFEHAGLRAGCREGETDTQGGFDDVGSDLDQPQAKRSELTVASAVVLGVACLTRHSSQ